MKFALLYYESADDLRLLASDPPAYWGAWTGYIEAIREAGVMAGGEGLQPFHTATTVRGNAVQDGPYADTKDQLGGFLIVDVPDVDQALEWAGRAPCAERGAVEVRPVLEM